MDYKKIIADITLTISMIVSVFLVDGLMKLFHIRNTGNDIIIFLIGVFLSIKILYNIGNKIGIHIYEKRKGLRK